MTSKIASAARRQLFERIQTEGALAGYEAALAVAQDKTAPPPARATAAGLLLRAAALLGTKPEDLTEKDASEMTADELQQAIDEIRSNKVSDGDLSNVFD